MDCTAPAAVTGITAAPGHNKVTVGWNHDGTDVDHYEVFAGLWHDGTGVSAYPEYDDLGNLPPTRPADYDEAVDTTPLDEWIPAGSSLTPGLVQTWADHLSRGVYYYEVFAVDAAGNASPAAAANDRATNYWLGDVVGDFGNLIPNGLVNVSDIDQLGANFYESVALGSPEGVLDVGPTDDWSRLGVPLTDNVINFEDLIVFSMNFGVVSGAKDMAPISDRAVLSWVDYGDGRYGLRLLDGPSLKGLHVTAGAEVVSVEAGALLDEQGEPTFVRNGGSGLNAVVAVMGVNNPFSGTGDLLVINTTGKIDPGRPGDRCPRHRQQQAGDQLGEGQRHHHAAGLRPASQLPQPVQSLDQDQLLAAGVAVGEAFGLYCGRPQGRHPGQRGARCGSARGALERPG